MRVLWIVNTIFQYPAEKLGITKTSFGGWLNGLAEELQKKDDIDLAIATVYTGKKTLEFKDEKTTYYLIPGAPAIKYDKNMEKHWKEINLRFNPDIVHIQGTEYTQGLAYRNIYSNAKVITSIQGLVSVCSKVYKANIPDYIIKKNVTFRDIIKNSNIINQQKNFEKRGKYEIELIKKSDAIIGRTTWDYANCKAINKDMKYYKCNESLRAPFYNASWDIKNIENHTIFCSQAGYPIKGIHYMLEALEILKEKYEDVKLIVAGNNILDNSTIKNKLKRTGYSKYIQYLVKKLNLSDNIEFTGILNENQMVEQLIKSNVFVSPSAIENSSNSLGEAMLIGLPCVASNVGGTIDMLDHKKEGFLYPYTEPAILAEYISRIFDNNELAIEIGENAKIKAKVTHNREKNVQDTMEIYKSVLK